MDWVAEQCAKSPSGRIEVQPDLTAAFSRSGKSESALVAELPDDISLCYQRSWKEHRRAQQKSADGINRRIHSLYLGSVTI